MSHTPFSTLILCIRNSNKGFRNRILSSHELKLKNCLFLLKRKKKHQTSIIIGFYLRGSLKTISVWNKSRFACFNVFSLEVVRSFLLANGQDHISLDVLVIQKHGHLDLIQDHFMHHNEAIISKDVRHLLHQHNISLRIANDSLIQEFQGLESFSHRCLHLVSEAFLRHDTTSISPLSNTLKISSTASMSSLSRPTQLTKVSWIDCFLGYVIFVPSSSISNVIMASQREIDDLEEESTRCDSSKQMKTKSKVWEEMKKIKTTDGYKVQCMHCEN
ncbi:uncharacterized protein G2W53_026714 [Senna tora]|uniref:Uncharacterized protein n=1 Tax=Senna tora TaxID=362788 RepID=A0A834THP0_9FABA|nr:uncharacterized protein G2W53_026714 [Senna tora]